jgi:hypothetical protein
MAEYCERDDILKRLTTAGLLALIDRDTDGTIGEPEYVDYVDHAIVLVGSLIDLSLQHLVDPNIARSSGNTFLKAIASALVIEQIATVGGADPSLSIHVQAERARKWLNAISSRTVVIPGLKYARPVAPGPQHNVPKGKVVNPR